MRRTRRGFSVLELLIVITLAALLLGLMLNNMGHSRANREVDQAANTLEGALNLARQTALNQNGARVALTLPTAGTDGSFSVLPGASGGSSVNTGQLPRTTEVVVSPAAAQITFNANGSSTAATNITVRSRRTNRQWTLTVARLSGSVQATQP